ncbi:hypothetical protein NEIRO03_0270 [Nematocida sp. AWRm78]|nr:hypothetical protein NEIRO02_0271 [Nematocida sp. AWRm79]KAI5182606.1 hypothetical protein NEIRO03_0270 [Nematocida sp. AWRm78]
MKTQHAFGIKLTIELIQNIKNYLILGVLPRYTTKSALEIFIKNSQLFQIENDERLYIQIGENKEKLFAIGDDDQEAIVKIFNQLESTHGHLKLYRMWKLIKNKWFGFKKERISKLIENCSGCKKAESQYNEKLKIKQDLSEQDTQSTQQSVEEKKGESFIYSAKIPIPDATKPMERLNLSIIDLIAYKDYNKGYTHILHIIDAYSGYHFIYPLTNCINISSQIIMAMRSLFRVEGEPAWIYAGKSMSNISIDNIGIQTATPITYVHGNARNQKYEGCTEAERMFFAFKGKLRRYIHKSDNQKTWLGIIDWIVAKLNRKQQNCTNITPQMLFKNKANKPILHIKELNMLCGHTPTNYRRTIPWSPTELEEKGIPPKESFLFKSLVTKKIEMPEFGDIVIIKKSNRSNEENSNDGPVHWMVLEEISVKKNHFLIGAENVTKVVQLKHIQVIEKNKFVPRAV